MSDPTKAAVALFIMVHGILAILTGRSLFYWLARGLDVLEAGQLATMRCLQPWGRRWVRQWKVEYRRLEREGASATNSVVG